MRVREILNDDYEAVQRVVTDNGLARIPRDVWGHLINTPHRDAGCKLPIGWALEDDTGSIVGVHGVYPVRYYNRGRPLLAAVAHTLAVNAANRLSTIVLMAPFFRLKSVDFMMSTSANHSASQYFQFNKARRFPLPYLSEILSWVVDYRAVAAAALMKKRVPAAAALAFPAATLVRIRDTLSGRNRFGCRSAYVHCIEGFDERFDRFWSRLVQASPYLLAMRDRASLQWHFEFALRKDRVRIIVIERDGNMTGYLILLRELRVPNQLLDRYHVVDLQLLDSAGESVEALMGGALRLARSEGIAMVDVVGLCPAKRQILEAMRPYHRTSDRWPYWYKPANPAETLEFANPNMWDPTLSDGDATLWNDRSGI